MLVLNERTGSEARFGSVREVSEIMEIRKRAIFGWCLFDWANSPFPTIVGTFVFSAYFALGIVGDQTEGSKIWGFALSVSGIFVLIFCPILGAIADHAGNLKRWIAFFTAVTCLGAAMLWFAEPDPAFIFLTLVFFILANSSLELSQVFYNALLTPNAPTGMIGRISGWAWGTGYVGAIVALVATLFLFVGAGDAVPPLVPLDKERAEHVRIVGPFTAAWFLVFCIPLFLFANDRPGAGLPIRQAVPKGLKSLIETIRHAGRHKQIVRFLIASAIYRDGLVTLFAVGGLYAADVHGMDATQLLYFAAGLNVTAGLGALGFAWMDDLVGSKPTILVNLAGLMVIGLAMLLTQDYWVFVGLALVLGIFVGPTQAASRSMMARLAPDEMETEMFGLYAFTGKAAAIFGPALYAIVLDATGDQRLGLSVVVVMFAIGGLILWTVKEPKTD